MDLLIDLLMVALAVSELGLWGTFVAVGSSVALDVPLALALGVPISDIFGIGLADDVLVAMLRLSFKLTDSLLLKTALAESEHLVREAFEHYDHTDEQNRRYAAYLQRQNPGQTYLFGDFTQVNALELGGSLGLLATRGQLRTVFEAARGKLADKLGFEVTSDAIAVGAELLI